MLGKNLANSEYSMMKMACFITSMRKDIDLWSLKSESDQQILFGGEGALF